MLEQSKAVPAAARDIQSERKATEDRSLGARQLNCRGAKAILGRRAQSLRMTSLASYSIMSTLDRSAGTGGYPMSSSDSIGMILGGASGRGGCSSGMLVTPST